MSKLLGVVTIVLAVAVAFKVGQLLREEEPSKGWESRTTLPRDYDPSRPPPEYVEECRRENRRFIARKNEDGIWTYDCL